MHGTQINAEEGGDEKPGSKHQILSESCRGPVVTLICFRIQFHLEAYRNTSRGSPQFGQTPNIL